MCKLYSFSQIPFNQLSLSGGASFGAVQVGMLKKINEIEQKKYDVYTGISIGAINAHMLSYFYDLNEGIDYLEDNYSSLHNYNFYKIFPLNKFSLYNPSPIYTYLENRINKFKNEPVIDTYIGATNLYTGLQDVYQINNFNKTEKINLLMASSAVPCVFPPVKFNNQLYIDGGLIRNYLLNINHKYQRNHHLNITLIDVNQYEYNSVNNVFDVFKRSLQILLNKNYNDVRKKIYRNKRIIGTINHYYIPQGVLHKYNSFNFKNSKKLMELGYNNLRHKQYNIYKTDTDDFFIMEDIIPT